MSKSAKLYQYKSGEYFGYVRKDGVLTRISLGMNKREAEKKLANWKSDHKAHRKTVTEIADQSFNGVWAKAETLLKGKRISARRLKLNESVWSAFRGFLEERGRKSLAEVIGDDINEFLSRYEQCASSTYNDRLATLRTVYTANCPEVLQGAASPFKFVSRQVRSDNNRLPFTAEEVEAIFRTAKEASTTYNWYGICAVANFTGLRLKDCINLNTVDIIDDVITLTPAKTSHSSGAKVTIPLHPTLKAVLAGITPENGYYFKNIKARYDVKETWATNTLARIIRAAGIDSNGTVKGRAHKSARKTFASFRTTFVTDLVSKGVSAMLIRQMVGHTTEIMTQTYAHSQISDLTSAVMAIPSHSDVEPTRYVPRETEQTAEAIVDKLISKLAECTDTTRKAVTDKLGEYMAERGVKDLSAHVAAKLRGRFQSFTSASGMEVSRSGFDDDGRHYITVCE